MREGNVFIGVCLPKGYVYAWCQFPSGGGYTWCQVPSGGVCIPGPSSLLEGCVRLVPVPFWRGGYTWSQLPTGYTSRNDTPPGEGTPLGLYTPQGRYTSGRKVHPLVLTSGIGHRGRRYSPYWNAFLLVNDIERLNIFFIFLLLEFGK